MTAAPGRAPWILPGLLLLVLSAPRLAQGEAALAARDFFEKVKLYGDVRLRHESNVALDDQRDRTRERLRMRLGVGYQPTDELLIGARLVTGDAEDPRSTHVTLGDGFQSLEVTLDRAFLTWRPKAIEGAWITAGKFAHPFRRNDVYGELLWDADVQPEGLSLGRSVRRFAGLEEARWVLGAYTLVETKAAQDAWALVAQVSGRAHLARKADASLSLGYYAYNDPTPGGATTLLAQGGANATVDRDGDGTPDDFRSRFGVLDTILNVDLALPRPLTFSAEYIKNTRARIDRDQGWALGVSTGKAVHAGDWRAYYQWQVVEQDAVFSPFAQDDFLLSVNHRSHLAGLRLQLTDRTSLHLWALVSARDTTGTTPTTDDDRPQWRLRLDLDVKL